jgi:DNA invertase Pin-like site-specific DNA recombinase
MKKTATSTACVLYARVSSKDQEQEGFSIPAQLRLLREYASAQGLRIVAEYIDVETARTTGRSGFNDMLAFLKKKGPAVRTILVEKTDRLYRNIKDWATLDEFGFTIHFVKEGVVIRPDSPSSDQLVHGLKVLMARNYSQNLSEETKKGHLQKALSGIYPSSAPAGYHNAEGPNGKRIIVPHPTEAAVITELYTLYATGTYSLQSLVKHARALGLSIRGKKLHVSTLHQILRRRIYNGLFDYDGTTYQGTHDPLVSMETWNAVQRILDGRKEGQTHSVRLDFPYTGLVRCGHCGCALVAELKKGRFTYYHCTGRRGKCDEPYTRQERLTEEFAATISDLVIPAPVLEWLADEITHVDLNEQGAREAAVKRLAAEKKRLEHRLNTLYEDRLDGTLSKDQYQEKAGALRAQMDEVQQKILDARDAPMAPLTTALDLARLTSNSCQSFLAQPPAEQRKLLTMLLKDATWKDGALTTTLLEPWELVRRSNRASATKSDRLGGVKSDLEIWLLR